MISRNKLLASIFLLSAALIAYEIFLIRLVSILFFPVATYLVISLAMLGFGISGAALAMRDPHKPISLAPILYGATGFSGAVLLAFMWAWLASSQLEIAVTMPLIFGLPFALGGWAIASALSRPDQGIHLVYFADLIGAGLGAGLILLGLFFLTGIQIIALIAALGFLAAAILVASKIRRYGILLAAAVLVSTSFWIPFPYGIVSVAQKELPLFAALGSQVRWEYQGWNPLARVDVLSLPGDRLDLPDPIEYKLVTQDGGSPTILLSADWKVAASFAEETVFGIPYWIKKEPAVFVIGVGGGPDILTALHYNARSITGVEINSQMIELVKGPYAEFTGHPYADPRVTIIQGDGRHIIRLSADRYDIIQLTGVDTTVASPGSNPNLADNYLYTVEAFRDYFRHLSPDGVFSISFPDMQGLSLRLSATAWEALRSEGVSVPQKQIVVSRTSGFMHLLVKQSPFTPEELSTLRGKFSRPLYGVYFPLYSRLFGFSYDLLSEIVYTPDSSRENAQTELFSALENGRGAEWMAAQPRDIRPVTDDRPFAFVLDKAGYYSPNQDSLMLSLALFGGATFVFFIAPLLFQSRRGFRLPGAPWLAVYFLSLGVGYIAVEVNLIQKLGLLLGHPSYSLATTLCVLLVSSGIGSYVSGRAPNGTDNTIFRAIGLVAVLVALGAAGIAPLIHALMSWPFLARLLAAVIVTALPGFFMGMPFPSGLDAVKREAPAFVPWAWALNGSGTVMGTLIALSLALAYGYTTVFIIAAGLYLLAGFAFFFYSRAAKPARA